VAVAAGLCDFSLGTDTGGSIRVPAACCGVLGLRTTHGAVSRQGLCPLAPSLDSIGLFARELDVLKRAAGALLPGQADAFRPEKPMKVRCTSEFCSFFFLDLLLHEIFAR
jgi:amidase